MGLVFVHWKTEQQCPEKRGFSGLRRTIGDSGEQIWVAEYPSSPSICYPAARQDFSAAFLKLREPVQHNS
jgi:hypothetical protein